MSTDDETALELILEKADRIAEELTDSYNEPGTNQYQLHQVSKFYKFGEKYSGCAR